MAKQELEVRTWERTGEWRELRINLAQEFVIAGTHVVRIHSTPLLTAFYAEGASKPRRLISCRAIRSGFRASVHGEASCLSGNRPKRVSFCESPEKRSESFGAGLRAEKMPNCAWV